MWRLKNKINDLEPKIEQKYKVIKGAESGGLLDCVSKTGNGYQELGFYVSTRTNGKAHK